MLQIQMRSTEYFDSENEVFIYVPEQTLTLEHSLISISRWESKWKQPFVNGKGLTPEKIRDYIKFMCINKNVSDLAIESMTTKDIKKVLDYLKDPQTATTINDHNRSPGNPNKKVTSEEIYAMMFDLGIPIECEKWNFNRLMTLIRVCQIRANSGGPKMSRRENLKYQSELNRARRAKMGSRG